MTRDVVSGKSLFKDFVDDGFTYSWRDWTLPFDDWKHLEPKKLAEKFQQYKEDDPDDWFGICLSHGFDENDPTPWKTLWNVQDDNEREYNHLECK